jgi:hypothetical protein
MAADISKSIVHATESLVLTAGIGSFDTYSVAVDLPSVAAGVSDTVQVTVTGVALGDLVLGVVPTTALTAGYHVLGAFVSGADTVQVFVRNDSGGTVDPASQTFTFIVADRT